MRNLFLTLLVTSALSVHAAYHHLSVIGVLECVGDKEMQENVAIDMYDHDGGVHRYLDYFNADDYMDGTMTNADGVFELYGSASDLEIDGLFENLPEPYINFTSRCRHDDGERLKFPLKFPQNPMDNFDVGIIMLDESVPGIVKYRRKVMRKNGEVWRNFTLDYTNTLGV